MAPPTTPNTTQQKDECKIGYSCGLACIDRDKTCLKNLSPEMIAQIKRLEKLILKSAGAIRADGTIDESKLGGLTAQQREGFEQMMKFILAKRDKLVQKVDERNQECKKNSRSDRCRQLDREIDRRIADMNSLADNINTIAKTFDPQENGLTDRDKTRKKDKTLTKEEFDGLKKRRDFNIELAEAMDRIGHDYVRAEDDPSKVKDDPVKVKAGLKGLAAKYENAFDQASAELARVWDRLVQKYKKDDPTLEDEEFPYDVYVPREFAEAAYKMYPPDVQNYMKTAGAIGSGIGMRDAEWDKREYNQFGDYVGLDGSIINYTRDTTGPNAVTNNRWLVMSDMFLRNRGRDLPSGTGIKTDTMQLEHYNGLNRLGILRDWKTGRRIDARGTVIPTKAERARGINPDLYDAKGNKLPNGTTKVIGENNRHIADNPIGTGFINPAHNIVKKANSMRETYETKYDPHNDFASYSGAGQTAGKARKKEAADEAKNDYDNDNASYSSSGIKAINDTNIRDRVLDKNNTDRLKDYTKEAKRVGAVTSNLDDDQIREDLKNGALTGEKRSRKKRYAMYYADTKDATGVQEHLRVTGMTKSISGPNKPGSSRSGGVKKITSDKGRQVAALWHSAETIEERAAIEKGHSKALDLANANIAADPNNPKTDPNTGVTERTGREGVDVRYDPEIKKEIIKAYQADGLDIQEVDQILN